LPAFGVEEAGVAAVVFCASLAFGASLGCPVFVDPAGRIKREAGIATMGLATAFPAG
jgi:hypothetical protein